MNSDKGQTTIEALLIAKATIALTTFVLLLTYFVIVRKWVDYWVYRAALCQVTGPAVHDCRRQLDKKILQVLPQHYYKWNSAWVTKKSSHIQITVTFSDRFTWSSQSTIPLPLVAARQNFLNF